MIVGRTPTVNGRGPNIDVTPTSLRHGGPFDADGTARYARNAEPARFAHRVGPGGDPPGDPDQTAAARSAAGGDGTGQPTRRVQDPGPRGAEDFVRFGSGHV